MSVPYAMLKAYQPTQGVHMDEFYTAETMMEIWNNELEAERVSEAYLDAYDPYMDFDDDYEYEDEEPQDPYEGREDIGMEAGLFGWDA
jgi:hypothetical protein